VTDIAFSAVELGNLDFINVETQYSKSHFCETQHQRKTYISQPHNANHGLPVLDFLNEVLFHTKPLHLAGELTLMLHIFTEEKRARACQLWLQTDSVRSRRT